MLLKNTVKYILNQFSFWAVSVVMFILSFFPKRKKVSKAIKLTWFGAYGNTNIGDDLIFFSIKKFIPDHIRIALSCRQQKPTTNYGVETFYKGENVYDFFRYIKKIKNSTHVLLGGGGLFEYYEFTWPAKRVLMNYLMPLMLAKIFNKPYGVVGMGVNEGRIPDLFLRCAFKKVLNSCDFIITRDEKSINGLGNNGVAGNLAWAYDPVFSLDLNHIWPSKVKNAGGIKNIGFLFWPYFLWPDFYFKNGIMDSEKLNKHKLFVKEIIELIHKLEKEGFKLTFPLFHFSDKIILKDIGVEYGDQEISIRQYFNKLEQCDILFSMRYHGQITALKSDIPVISIPVQEKMNELVLNFNLDTYSITPENFTAELAYNKLKSLVEDFDKVKSVIEGKSLEATVSVETLYQETLNSFLSK